MNSEGAELDRGEHKNSAQVQYVTILLTKLGWKWNWKCEHNKNYTLYLFRVVIFKKNANIKT